MSAAANIESLRGLIAGLREEGLPATADSTEENLSAIVTEITELKRQRDEAFALLKEIYTGDYPTNLWRKRVEDLGAWPVAIDHPRWRTKEGSRA